MITYEDYAKIRDKVGMSDYSVSKKAGIGQSTLSDWKHGRSNPKQDKMKKISFALGVDLLNKKGDEAEKYYLNDETTKIAQEIFENEEMRVLFDAARDAQPEDLKTVYDMLLALKRKEKGD